MQDKLTSWFLGLPAIVIILVLALVSVLWFGVRYLDRREKFWMGEVKALREQTNDIMEKLFMLFQDSVNRETTFAQRLDEFEKSIDEWFRK